MKSSSFICPYDSLVKSTHAILLKKGYDIISVNSVTGIIEARRKEGLFKKRKLTVKVYKINETVTGIKLTINGNPNSSDTIRTPDDYYEEKLMDSILNYF